MPKIVRLLLGLAALGLLLTGCTTENNLLRNVAPGTTVYIDAFYEQGEVGDQAQVEQKPSGLWVLPLDARYTLQPDAQHTVKVTLTRDGRFVIDDVDAGTMIGVDRDNCLADGETYVLMADPDLPKLLREAPSQENTTEQDTDCMATPAS